MIRLGIGLLVASLWTLSGCVGAQPPGTSAPTAATTPSPTATPTPLPSPTPAQPQATPSTTPTVLAVDPCALSTEEDPASPPEAVLTGADGTAVAGRIGSYNYCGLAVDALPPRAVSLAAVPIATDVTIATTGVEGFVAYRAGYWPATEWQGDEIGYASDDLAAPAEEATFATPPSGDWMFALNLTFASGGDAVWYWHVTVP